MKKLSIVICCLMLVLAVLAGCAGKNTPAGEQTAADIDADISVPNTPTADGGVTLADMRKAAGDLGYSVTDGHNLVFMKDVRDGFSVQIVADGQDTVYSVIECETEDAAVKNASDIDDAGYNIAIRNGRFLTCYGVDKKDGVIKDLLTSILNGEAAN